MQYLKAKIAKKSLIKICVEIGKFCSGISIFLMKGSSFPLPLNLPIYDIHMSVLETKDSAFKELGCGSTS